MESVIHHDYRQKPIASDTACEQYRNHLAKIEAMIATQEDVVAEARARSEAQGLARARSSLWRLLTKRQGVIDAIEAYTYKRA